MTVRAKFVCTSKVGEDVAFSPVTSGSEENRQFYKYTPGGSISLTTINEAALAVFEPGRQYYVDFTPAESRTEVVT